MKKLCVGNWKMNCDRSTFSRFDPSIVKSRGNVEVGIAVPFTYIQTAKDRFGDMVHLCAQDCSQFESGSYTGEVGAAMLKEFGVKYLILGHSERRSLLEESDATILHKMRCSVEASIEVILCVGETMEQRRSNKTVEVITGQLAVLSKVSGLKKINIAYEPVWAIGTGAAADAKDIESAFGHIQRFLSGYSLSSRILYGGSVNNSNCRELSKVKGLDGFLVGNASLKDEFSSIVDSLSQ